MSTKQYIVTIERRRDSRQRVRLEAHILSEDGDQVFPCIIANISMGGIKIDLPLNIDLPNHFTLRESTLGTEFDCAIQWRKSTEVGLKFVTVSNLDNLQKLILTAEKQNADGD